jgi:hypothetical protein
MSPRSTRPSDSRRRIGWINFTESSDILSDFPWAERHKAKVCDLPLVLIGDILSPGGSDMGCCGPMGERLRMCCLSGRFRSRLPLSYLRRRGRGCPCLRASSGSKRSLEGEV